MLWSFGKKRIFRCAQGDKTVLRSTDKNRQAALGEAVFRDFKMSIIGRAMKSAAMMSVIQSGARTPGLTCHQ